MGGKIKFYREVEVKHARMAMLAAIGFPVAEQFHPLFASDDAPSFTAFQQTPPPFDPVKYARAQGDADQGAQQRPPRHDCHCRHGRPGGCLGWQALLDCRYMFCSTSASGEACGCRMSCT